MKGYKAFWKKDGKLFTGGMGGSKVTEWKIGETKKVKGKISLCANGFHFFEEKNFCFAFDFFTNVSSDTAICEVEIFSEVEKDTYKCVCSELKVIKEVTSELLKKIDDKTNSGDSNSGNSNSGDSNSGNSNSGDSNSGNSNSGDSNSGDSNSGNSNSGDSNSGNSNSGDSNSGNSNSGIFNTDEPYMRAFNKQTKIKYSDWVSSSDYIYFDIDLEGKTYKEAWKEWWKKNKSEDMIARIKRLPGFSKKIFKEITGITIK